MLVDFMLRRPPVNFLFGVLADVAILFLEQADELVEFAPPLFDLTPQLLPLAFKYISSS